MKKVQSGFTIIEIMIVTAIIGILAVIGIRSMNGYAVRAKVSEAMNMLASCRTVIAEVYISGDSIPSAGTWGCESSGNVSKFVDTIDTTDEGIIKIGLRGVGDLRVDFHTITMAPLDTSGNLMSSLGRVSRWRCGAVGDGTDINVEFLPATCRGN
jgi:type IV pilus assembly protein PilA